MEPQPEPTQEDIKAAEKFKEDEKELYDLMQRVIEKYVTLDDERFYKMLALHFYGTGINMLKFAMIRWSKESIN